MITADMARKIAAHLDAGNIDVLALTILEDAVIKASAASKTEGMPVVRLAPHGIRPQYLASCPGRLGNQRGERVEFFPDPGTRAHQRSKGGAWKIRLLSLDVDSQIIARNLGRF